MKCPVDGQVLSIADRQGVEIDYCPTCRGVWLDRGELDKLIERAEAAPGARDVHAGERSRAARDVPPPPAYGSRDKYRDDDDDDWKFGQSQGYGQGRRKKSSWLGEILDFG